MTTVLPQKSPSGIFKRIGDEAVLFCSRSEIYFGLNEVGILIWEMLPEHDSDASPTMDDLVDALGENFADVERSTLEADAQEFLRQLRKSELVSDADARDAEP